MTTDDDLARLARDVLNARHDSYVEDAATAAAGVTLARAVIARAAEAEADRFAHREVLLAHHVEMLAHQQRAIERLTLANRKAQAGA